MPLSSTSVERLFDVYLRECAMYNRSEATVRSYRETKNHLFKLIPGIDEKEISVLNKQWIGEYTRLLRDSGISVASTNHYLRNIRAFVYWCVENDYLLPYKVKLLTETETVKTAYSNDELRVLLRKPSAGESFCTWRTWAIINLILSIGSRASTVVNILKEDVDFKQNRIMTKHNKNRRIKAFPISVELKGVLVEYMRHFVCEETPYLFPSFNGSKFTVSGLQCSMYKYNRARGVSKCSVHLFRHTFGKLWAEQGGGVYELQNILDHSDIRTTQRYINSLTENCRLKQGKKDLFQAESVKTTLVRFSFTSAERQGTV